MKKILILSALAATMGIISSCSEDDGLTSNSGIDSNVIAFATHSASAKTRSAVTLTSIDKFNVCAVTDDNSPYFTGVDYTFDSSLGVFKSSVPHYWPTAGTVSFYAISDPGTYSADADNVPHYSYTDWAAEKDLVAATVIAGEKTIPYPLTFRHVTSQVKISAEAENKTEELTYKLVSVKMTCPSTGTYSFAKKTGGAGSWEIENNKTSQYSYDDALPISFDQNSTANPTDCYWNILPVTDGKIAFDIEYQVLQNGKVIADCTGSASKKVTVSNPDLSMGKIYTYNFILPVSTNDEITFTLSMTEWEKEDAVSIKAKRLVERLVLNYDSLRLFETMQRTMKVDSIIPADAEDQSYEWETSDASIVSITDEGLLTAVAPGTATVYARALDGSGTYAQCRVVVSELDTNGKAYVDLGLPSGTLWAAYNVGSTSSSNAGGWYAWGETETKDTYTEANYKWYGNSKYKYTKYVTKYDSSTGVGDGLTDLELEDDAAHVNMGGNWRMPTEAQVRELFNTDNNQISSGLSGSITSFWLTSKTNGKKLYVPYSTSYKKDSGWYNTAAWYVFYIRTSYKYYVGAQYKFGYIDYAFRYAGMHVRGCMQP